MRERGETCKEEECDLKKHTHAFLSSKQVRKKGAKVSCGGRQKESREEGKEGRKEGGMDGREDENALEEEGKRREKIRSRKDEGHCAAELVKEEKMDGARKGWREK